MKKVKIIKLMGGLGNQMFQYAFGRFLEEKFDCIVYYDKSYYKNHKSKEVNNTGLDKHNVAIRNYELYVFPFAKIKFINSFIINLFKLLTLLKIPGFNRYKERNAFVFNEELENKDYLYYSGYFQNEKYYRNLKNKLIKEFALPELKDDYNKELLERIKDSRNPVFIHVRRGEDYNKLGFSLNLNYYKSAVQYIKEHVENPTFFVFCAEDVDYIKNEFDIGCEFQLIGEKNKTRENFYENMRLMNACKHAIIANSSYSWWAAWLSEDNDRIVIAPSQWLNREDGIICENWIKIRG